MENFIDNGAEWMQKLLDFRNWIHDIRQQSNQGAPDSFRAKINFGPFLLKTRREMLDRLLRIQDSMPIELIGSDELHYVCELIGRDSEQQILEGLKEFVFELPNGNRIATISDFNIVLSQRSRLGGIYLKQAKFIETRSVPFNYSNPTRIMYYLY